MKITDAKSIDTLPGTRLSEQDTFTFRCHSGLPCFNRCCRNLNLFLYPYDVLRLKNHLGLTSEAFLERYVNIVLREGRHFPDVLLTMTDDEQRSCPFLGDRGCRVYADRPDTCRSFPVEQGEIYQAASGETRPVFFLRPPDFCQGRQSDVRWTILSYRSDQGADTYYEMTRRWAELQRLFGSDPWHGEGPSGRRARMAFMATYNMEGLRDFLFNSSFLRRYKVKPALVRRIRDDETARLRFGFEWIKLFIWGIPSRSIRRR